MSWSEIKKAVNSDLSKPLNEKIDNEIREKRLGLGFATCTEPILNGEVKNSYSYVMLGQDIRQPAIEFYNNNFYLLGGSQNRGAYSFKRVSSLDYKNTVSSMTDIPFAFSTSGISFVYKGYIHAINETIHYKWSDDTGWVKAETPPQSLINGFAYVYKEKVYIVTANIVGFFIYDGTWSYIEESGIAYGGLYEKDGKLYLLRSNGITYYLDEEKGNFITDNNIPRAPFSDMYGIAVVDKDGDVHAIFNNKHYALIDNEWKKLNEKNSTYKLPNYGHKAIFYNNYVYYIITDINGTIVKCNLNEYVEYSYLLPKNTNLFIPDLKQRFLYPIENCEVIGDGRIKVLQDGIVKFRTVKNNPYFIDESSGNEVGYKYCLFE